MNINYKQIIDNLEEMVLKKNNTIKDLLNTKKSEEDKSIAQESKITQLNEVITKLQIQIEQFKEISIERNNRILDSFNLLDDRENKITELNAINQELSDFKANYIKDLESVSLNALSITAELESHKAYLKQEKKNIKSLKKKVHKYYTGKIKDLENEIAELESKMAKSKIKREKDLENLTNELHENKIINKEHVDQISKFKVLINDLNKENKFLKDELNKELNSTKQLSIQYEQILDDLEKKYSAKKSKSSNDKSIDDAFILDNNLDKQLRSILDLMGVKIDQDKSWGSLLEKLQLSIEKNGLRDDSAKKSNDIIALKYLIDSRYNAENNYKSELQNKLSVKNLKLRLNQSEKKNRLLSGKLNIETQKIDKESNQIGIEQELIVLSINPDFKDDFGHFKLYDELIENNLKKNYNIRFISLIHKECNEKIFQAEKHIKAFTLNSWKTGRDRELTHENYNLFREEVRSALVEVRNRFPKQKISLFMYCGSFNQAIIISELIKSDKNIFAHINTFWDHFNKSYIHSENHLLQQKLLTLHQADQLKIYSDSEELDEIFTKNLDVAFDIWPVFSLMNGQASDYEKTDPSEKIKIFFPGKIRMAKGFDLTVQFSNWFFENYSSEKYELILRAQIYDNTSSVEKGLLAKIGDKATIITGDVSDEEFKGLMSDSDLIVLPYKKDEFITRTSGLFCDSIFFGKPMVTTQGTWLGNRIEKLGNGSLFLDDDFSSLCNAVENVLSNLSQFQNNSMAIRDQWLKNNSLDSLCEKLIEPFEISTKKSIMFYPRFENQEEFENQYIRLLWYSNPIAQSIEHIYVPVNGKNISIDKIEKVPQVHDPDLFEFRKNIDSKIKFFDFEDSQTYINAIDSCDAFLEWNIARKSKMDQDIYNTILSKKSIKDFWRVDTENERNEASFYSRLSLFLNVDNNLDLELSKLKFDLMVQQLKEKRKRVTYVYGTGPSLSQANDPKFDLSNGYNIVCNSMVKNLELLDKLQPEIIVAADPIFHSGCSSYAAAFRKDLLIAMDRYDAYFIVPLRDYKIYIENLPKRYESKIIGIPFNNDQAINLSLNHEFYVVPFPNILTLFMIPIACTISNEICIMGCDGRKLEDNQYFWSHDKSSQFNDKMEEIKIAHPAFFKIDYNDYYIEHINQLKNIIQLGQSVGKKFVNLTKSYIPILEDITDLNYFDHYDTVEKILSRVNNSDQPFIESVFLKQLLSETLDDKSVCISLISDSSVGVVDYLDLNFENHVYLYTDNKRVQSLEDFSSSNNLRAIDNQIYTDIDRSIKLVDYCKSNEIKSIDFLNIGKATECEQILNKLEEASISVRILTFNFNHIQQKELLLSTRLVLKKLNDLEKEYLVSETVQNQDYLSKSLWLGLYSSSINNCPGIHSNGFVLAYDKNYSPRIQGIILNHVSLTINSVNSPIENFIWLDGKSELKIQTNNLEEYKLEVSLELKQNHKSTNLFTRNSPPMPFIIGHWKLYDLGKSTFRIYNDHGIEIIKDFKIANEGLFNISIISNKNEGTKILVNDVMIYSTHRSLPLGKNVIIGNGALERYWEGKFLSVKINEKELTIS